MLVIGGGATGLGVAVDAASRGYRVALVEQSDFAKGTSSRSTKLVHGGVRYLQQGNISLVIEALKERGLLRRNAPHLVNDLAFIVPSYQWWESPFYGIGLKVYDALAGKYGFGRSRHFDRDEIIERIPTIETEGLRGGTLYYDGQFDDARLAINLAQTAVEQGACCCNYVRCAGLVKDDAGQIEGVELIDEETGEGFEVRARVVINATGPFADGVRRMDDPEAPAMIAPSQGAHVVLPERFVPHEHAIMVPHTSDGRVMFAIPWHDVCVVGTTDVPIENASLEPRPMDEEIDFILETAARYLGTDATRADVLSVFAGIRPLVRTGDGKKTASLSRDHTITIDPVSGLLTVAGGKWTTYRKMAEDVVDHAAPLAGLDPVQCATGALAIHGSMESEVQSGRLGFYGSDAHAVRACEEDSPDGSEPVHARLPITRGQVRFSARREMARTVDDVLARRTRALLFDARAAKEAARTVAEILAEESAQDSSWVNAQNQAFGSIADRYVLEF